MNFIGTPREATREEIIEFFGVDPDTYGYILYMSPWEEGVVLTARRYERAVGPEQGWEVLCEKGI